MDIDLVNESNIRSVLNKSSYSNVEGSVNANLGSFVSKGFNSLNSLEYDQAEAKKSRSKHRLIKFSLNSSDEEEQISSESSSTSEHENEMSNSSG